MLILLDAHEATRVFHPPPIDKGSNHEFMPHVFGPSPGSQIRLDGLSLAFLKNQSSCEGSIADSVARKNGPWFIFENVESFNALGHGLDSHYDHCGTRNHDI